MKLLSILAKTIFVSSIFLFLNINHGCRDPYQYAPPEDSLVPPPDEIPQLIYPPNDTGIVYGQHGHGWDTLMILFKWSEITDAEYYDLALARDTFFIDSTTVLYTVSRKSILLTFFATGDFYWRVRAGNIYRTWYTDWSETWHLRLARPVSK